MENGSSNSYHTHTYFIGAAGVDIIEASVYNDWPYRLLMSSNNLHRVPLCLSDPHRALMCANETHWAARRPNDPHLAPGSSTELHGAPMIHY